jgi:hypothetical protein
LQLVVTGEGCALFGRPPVLRVPDAAGAVVELKRVEVVGEGLRQNGSVQCQAELARLQLIGGRICKDETLAITEAEPEIPAFLGNVAKNVVERRDTITFEPHDVVGAEVADQVATVALLESESVCTTRSGENVVARAAIDRLAA